MGPVPQFEKHRASGFIVCHGRKHDHFLLLGFAKAAWEIWLTVNQMVVHVVLKQTETLAVIAVGTNSRHCELTTNDFFPRPSWASPSVRVQCQ